MTKRELGMLRKKAVVFETAESKAVASEKMDLIRILAQSFIVFAALTGIFALFIYCIDRVYYECYAEAGVSITPQDFLKKPDAQAYFTAESDVIDVSKPGEYHVVIKTGLFSYNSVLYVKDSIAPQGQAVEVAVEIGQECGADSFVTNLADATQVSVAYVEEPDFSKPGMQQVGVVLTDLGGNETVIESKLFISQVVSELTIEAGSQPPKLSDFVIKAKEAEFLSLIKNYNYMQPSEKTVYIKADGTIYKTRMCIVDTIPPKVELKDVSGYTLAARRPEDFVSSVEDVTGVKLEFIKEPDVRLEGRQIVSIRVTDEGGNAVAKSARLTLMADEEPPVISGVTDLHAAVGGSISYKENVTVSDNCPEGVHFSIDNSAVNVNVAGTYPVTYTAIDMAGNQTSVSVNVIVGEKAVTVYTESQIYALADGVLSKIITPDMTQYQKVQAIFNYTRKHISYKSNSKKGNWLRSAYQGFTTGKGDCYVYASTMRALLTRAGITNMEIAKIPAKTVHFWNLVDLGEGWYHVDATPRKDGTVVFMWEDARLLEYSNTHNLSHNYDRTQYPAVN